MKLKTFDLSYFLKKNIFGDHVSQNIFVCQPRLSTLKLREDKGTDYILSRKSKGVYLLNLKICILLSYRS